MVPSALLAVSILGMSISGRLLAVVVVIVVAIVVLAWFLMSRRRA